jgi:hypothetical protein
LQRSRESWWRILNRSGFLSFQYKDLLGFHNHSACISLRSATFLSTGEPEC